MSVVMLMLMGYPDVALPSPADLVEDNPIRKSIASKWISSVFGAHKKCLIVGLERAGKTGLLYRLMLGEPVKTVPTVGYNCETVRIGKKGQRLTYFDVGGHPKIRSIWKSFVFSGCACVVFVVSAAAQDDPKRRWPEVRRELTGILEGGSIQGGVPFLFVASKSDLPAAQSLDEMRQELDIVMSLETKRKWELIAVSSETGEGLQTMTDW
eukprot:CAMPEP_0119133146 /NCGR_PEP_ID=MMETSP1310-20130426/13090_1 /TAXON_ID=464262 /ORGANISM="Genus nov. species nov., Strain RCC2339" /LENGTH=209 /DNA_ID=CAMNT_0007123825 /DNA_START=31 /DNA_END=657 /DNA_ORIENTATION=+